MLREIQHIYGKGIGIILLWEIRPINGKCIGRILLRPS
jgi:hypothetical protein